MNFVSITIYDEETARYREMPYNPEDWIALQAAIDFMDDLYFYSSLEPRAIKVEAISSELNKCWE